MTSNYPRGDLHRLHLNTSQCLNAIIYIYIYMYEEFGSSKFEYIECNFEIIVSFDACFLIIRF